jgi:hypothetical protein
VIATELLDAVEGWVPFKSGELRVYRSGRLAGRMMTRPTPTATIINVGDPESGSASKTADLERQR